MTKAKAKKPKKTNVSAGGSRLDALKGKLHKVLRSQTFSIIEAGEILLEIKDDPELGHGKWMSWVTENFDLSQRSANRYVSAAKYVAGKPETAADFANLAPGVLYDLAAGEYSEKEETAILAATFEGRVDDDRALAICEALVPPPPSSPPEDDAEDQGGGDDDGHGGEAEGSEAGGGEAEAGQPVSDEEEARRILDGSPPEVPPPPPPENHNFDLDHFNSHGEALLRLATKPAATFARTALTRLNLRDLAGLFDSVADLVEKAKPGEPNEQQDRKHQSNGAVRGARS